MYCPMLNCKWTCSELTSTEEDGSEVRQEDNLVTQFATLVDHLQDDHGAVVGGKK